MILIRNILGGWLIIMGILFLLYAAAWGVVLAIAFDNGMVAGTTSLWVLLVAIVVVAGMSFIGAGEILASPID